MSNIPRDPRQLARDILAGKISIEELAREQQRRRGGQPPASQTPQRIPLPRTAPPPPPRLQPPRPVARKPIPAPPSQQRQPPRPTARIPQTPLPSRQPAPVRTIVKPAPPPAEPIFDPQRNPNAGLTAKSEKRSESAVLQLLPDKAALRRAIILSEILAPPLALRDTTEI